MSVQIVKKEERLIHEMSGSKFFYRRISTRQRAAIVRKHTKRGKTDWSAVTADIIQYVILGWESVQIDKQDVPFDADLALDLPEDVLGEIVELSGGAGDDEDVEKN